MVRCTDWWYTKYPLDKTKHIAHIRLTNGKELCSTPLPYQKAKEWIDRAKVVYPGYTLCNQAKRWTDEEVYQNSNRKSI